MHRASLRANIKFGCQFNYLIIIIIVNLYKSLHTIICKDSHGSVTKVKERIN